MYVKHIHQASTTWLRNQFRPKLLEMKLARCLFDSLEMPNNEHKLRTICRIFKCHNTKSFVSKRMTHILKRTTDKSKTESMNSQWTGPLDLFLFNFFPSNLFQFHKSSIFLKNLFGFCFSSTHKSVHSIIYQRIKWWRRESCVLMRCLFKKKKKQDTRGVDIVLCAAWKHQQFFYERIAHVFPSWSKTMIVQSPGYTSIRCRR